MKRLLTALAILVLSCACENDGVDQVVIPPGDPASELPLVYSLSPRVLESAP
ncbi:MAG: hypothetical protein IIB61_09160 [Planctomycetes bacterium]|nr:hypothetical protein [Planctomycetota bacterium]